MSAADQFSNLVKIMARLRDAEKGCPWDLEQDFSTIVPYTLEEAYEVADAIERKDYMALRDELGDLLFQVIFHAQIATEQRLFDIEHVCSGICDKLIRRHPHIFADEAAATPEAVARRWDEIKTEERATGSGQNQQGQMDGLASALPALKYAQKMQRRAAHVGFDWPDSEGARDKLHEELAELEAAQLEGTARDIEEELGDLLFSCVNLSRHLGVDAEHALRLASKKFAARFRHMESLAESSLSELNSSELEQLWLLSKNAELH